jgi:UDP-N-acetylglucosamine 4,6-dehydratase/5-epimerase
MNYNLEKFSNKINFGFYENQTLLITGGTGSFGNYLVSVMLDNYKLKKLIILSRDENKQYIMNEKFKNHKNFHILRFFIGDVRDLNRLDMAMRDVDYVIHAAALKHVPVAEYNPFECIKTNVYGAENIVNAAIRNNVKKVLALSTDKATNPINLYGASKLASDKIFVAANHLSNKKTDFSVVRYGNVVGSRGSVIPLFKKLIKENAPYLPITDMQMTRFWINLDDSIKFVLSTIPIMIGGEIFIPRIPSAKVSDIVEVLAPGYPVQIIGIRPGEKLHEIMITEDDARATMEFEDRYIIQPLLMGNWDKNYYTKFDYKNVPDNFSYQSNLNEHWLNQSQLKSMLNNLTNDY